jgi:hypothetical protein
MSIAAVDSGHGDLPVIPRRIRDFAHTHAPIPGAQFDTATISSVPNAGWSYLRSPMQSAIAVVHINGGFQPGTAFYNMQHSGIDPVTGDPFCSKSQMPLIERGAREHEGIINGAIVSHMDVYRTWFSSHAPQDSMESVVGFHSDFHASWGFKDLVEVEWSQNVADPAYSDPDQRHTTDVPPGLVQLPTVPCRPRF